MTDTPSKYGLRARDRRSSLHKFHPTCKILPTISENFLEYFVLYFLTRVFLAYFSSVICVQYGGFPREKRGCNAAIPAASPCTIGLNFNYFGDVSVLHTVL